MRGVFENWIWMENCETSYPWKSVNIEDVLRWIERNAEVCASFCSDIFFYSPRALMPVMYTQVGPSCLKTTARFPRPWKAFVARPSSSTACLPATSPSWVKQRKGHDGRLFQKRKERELPAQCPRPPRFFLLKQMFHWSAGRASEVAWGLCMLQRRNISHLTTALATNPCLEMATKTGRVRVREVELIAMNFGTESWNTYQS